jgi:hypothetical protein
MQIKTLRLSYLIGIDFIFDSIISSLRFMSGKNLHEVESKAALTQRLLSSFEGKHLST